MCRTGPRKGDGKNEDSLCHLFLTAKNSVCAATVTDEPCAPGEGAVLEPCGHRGGSLGTSCLERSRRSRGEAGQEQLLGWRCCSFQVPFACGALCSQISLEHGAFLSGQSGFPSQSVPNAEFLQLPRWLPLPPCSIPGEALGSERRAEPNCSFQLAISA